MLKLDTQVLSFVNFLQLPDNILCHIMKTMSLFLSSYLYPYIIQGNSKRKTLCVIDSNQEPIKIVIGFLELFSVLVQVTNALFNQVILLSWKRNFKTLFLCFHLDSVAGAENLLSNQCCSHYQGWTPASQEESTSRNPQMLKMPWKSPHCSKEAGSFSTGPCMSHCSW